MSLFFYFKITRTSSLMTPLDIYYKLTFSSFNSTSYLRRRTNSNLENGYSHTFLLGCNSKNDLISVMNTVCLSSFCQLRKDLTSIKIVDIEYYYNSPS